MYIVIGILKVCENAKIHHMQFQKVELGSQNAKKLKFYYLGYPDSHKFRTGKGEKKFSHF